MRPTSETVIGEFMAKWVQSYRDLPLLLNQWANVVRWELRPRVFLRTTEFLWQEGHTAHATQDDARRLRARRSSTTCTRTSWSTCSPCRAASVARRPRERFPGAINTMTCEAMMRDGKALQMGTSHELGQNFARVFDIELPRRRRARSSSCWTTSWGVSTRMVGGLIMGHGDDAGLRVPPASRPSRSSCCSCATRTAPARPPSALAAELRAPACGSSSTPGSTLSFGRRATDWELKGVPVRLELGPRDLAEGEVTLVRRDTRRQGHGALGARGRTGRRRSSSGIQADLLAEATERAATPRTVEAASRRRGRRGRPDRLRPHALGAWSATRARRGWPSRRHHRPLPPPRRTAAARGRRRDRASSAIVRPVATDRPGAGILVRASLQSVRASTEGVGSGPRLSFRRRTSRSARSQRRARDEEVSSR